MTQRCFQSAVARLVLDPDFRDRVRAQGAAALDDDLTPVERARVISIVDDRGLDATRTLHKSFRLSKIYTLLPLTRVLLGPDRLAREVSEFWKLEPPVSHYFLEEAIRFCDFLRSRIASGLRIKYLEEVVRYERAGLELRRPRTSDDVAGPQLVKFDHDPVILLSKLLGGKRPRAVSALSCTLVGRLGPDGEVQWDIATDGIG